MHLCVRVSVVDREPVPERLATVCVGGVSGDWGDPFETAPRSVIESMRRMIAGRGSEGDTREGVRTPLTQTDTDTV